MDQIDQVPWDDFTVQLDLKNKHNSTVSVGGQPYSGKEKKLNVGTRYGRLSAMIVVSLQFLRL
jgi:hypothetical protein